MKVEAITSAIVVSDSYQNNQNCVLSNQSPNFKLVRSPRTDSKESIPPAYVAWRAGTTTLHSYKSWGLIPPAWLDDTILNLQANGIYFRHVSWVNTSSLSDFLMISDISDDIGHFRNSAPPPPPCNKMAPIPYACYGPYTQVIRTRSSLHCLLRSYHCTTRA